MIIGGDIAYAGRMTCKSHTFEMIGSAEEEMSNFE